jgi:hypothetical protein
LRPFPEKGATSKRYGLFFALRRPIFLNFTHLKKIGRKMKTQYLINQHFLKNIRFGSLRRRARTAYSRMLGLKIKHLMFFGDFWLLAFGSNPRF